MSKTLHTYPEHIPILTTLRFYAAFLVFVHHLQYFLPDEVLGFSGIVEKGRLAVDFFFILSGFILSHVYFNKIKNKRITPYKFYIKRLARIYPLHIVTLFMMWGLGALGLTAVGMVWTTTDWTVLNQLLLLHGWGLEPGLAYNGPSWSISAEWFAYLLFPSLVMLLCRFDVKYVAIASVLIFFALWFASLNNEGGRLITERTYDFSIIRIVPEFVIGMALYLYFQGRVRLPYALCLFWLAIIAFMACLHFAVSDVYPVLLSGVIIVLAADLSKAPEQGRALSNPFLLWMGEISYAFFMVHYVVLSAVFNIIFVMEVYTLSVLQTWFMVGLCLVLSVMASAVLYHLVERPAQKFILKRFA